MILLDVSRNGDQKLHIIFQSSTVLYLKALLCPPFCIPTADTELFYNSGENHKYTVRFKAIDAELDFNLQYLVDFEMMINSINTEFNHYYLHISHR